MTAEDIVEILRANFAEAILGVSLASKHPSVAVAAEKWYEIAAFLRDDPRIWLNMLRCISGVDRIADGVIEVIYDLVSITPPNNGKYWVGGNEIAIKLRVPRDGGCVPSVASVWPAANWHEREVFDLFGVSFTGHPDHRRILLPDDWVGYPLRKDYEYPAEYEGIPGMIQGPKKSP